MAIMPHTVRLNNFIQRNENSIIDHFSKMYIILELFLGLNRVSALTRKNLVQFLSCLYSAAAIAFVMYVAIAYSWLTPRDIVEYTKLLQYTVCGVLGFASRKRIRKFYSELNKFDLEFGCKPKVSRESCLILLSMTVLCSFILLTFCLKGILRLIPVHLIYIIENHYFGFLFNLLNQRLRMINGCLESTLISNVPLSAKTIAFIVVDLDGKTLQVEMRKDMDLYYRIISGYDLLIDAIKWQLLVITITSFIYTLAVSYQIAINLIRFEGQPLPNVVMDVLLVASEILPLMAPCLCCDVLRFEVRKLRELLASKLFESELDKSDRSTARALLALTKARNLSFSLLRIVNISVSLPFSYLGLLATDLIIMLQFEKVLYPQNYAATLKTPV